MVCLKLEERQGEEGKGGREKDRQMDGQTNGQTDRHTQQGEREIILT